MENYDDEYVDYEESVRRLAEYILASQGKKYIDEDIENLAEELMLNDYNASWYPLNFNETYQNTYAELYDRNNYYEIIIYCPHAKNKNSIKKIKMLNKHLLIHVGEREYRYQIEGREYIIPRLACVIYLPLSDDVNDILKYSVRNGTIHVEIGKST